MVCRLYVWACRKWRRSKLTFSASAFQRATAGRGWWRNRIDGFFLLFFSQHRHCRHHYRRETRSTTDRQKAPCE
jgi:hypothetical protein